MAYTMEEFAPEDYVEQLLNDGDEDAALIPEYESSAVEALQDDPDLASARSTYLEARHRLSKRRIMESSCRLCGNNGIGKPNAQIEPVRPPLPLLHR